MTTPAESYAAIDLGSNSFHMIVTGVQGDSFQVIDKIKDTVRLAAGLDEKNYLSEEASQRAIDCLQKFGQRIKDIPRRNIRAVGTNTLRQAKNSSEFMKQARKALGHPIEIISGREEARLIFLGVAHGNHNEEEQRLIVDIGGGSTEVAIGRGYHAHLVESLYMGCVNMSDRFFKNGEVTAKKMRKAILYALQEMEFIETTYRRNGWEAVYGASGTIRAIYDITAGDIADNYITPEGLNGLKEQLISAGNIDNFTSPALSANRAPVLAGGVAILCAVFESLYIERMYISDSALREGLILDLVGRQHDRDIREKTVEELIARYNIDVSHAVRVADTASAFLQQVSDAWSLIPEADGKLLRWASLLHEIGIAIAHSQHHKHAAYLLNNSELPGFSRQEQSLLSLLVRYHRRKILQPDIQTQAGENYLRMVRLLVLLRLAVVLNRSRSDKPLPPVCLGVHDNHINIDFPVDWLLEHPLTGADLETEADYLTVLDFKLEFS